MPFSFDNNLKQFRILKYNNFLERHSTLLHRYHQQRPYCDSGDYFICSNLQTGSCALVSRGLKCEGVPADGPRADISTAS